MLTLPRRLPKLSSRHLILVMTLSSGLALSLVCSQKAFAQSRSYCAVEIGAKGVKARQFEFGLKGTESSIGLNFNKDINTTIVASMKDGAFQPAAIDETAQAVASLMKQMKEVAPQCKAFVVGSSGVAVASNKLALQSAVAEKAELESMDFVTAAQEAEFGFNAAVPKKEWNNAVIVDIGSGNTKIGYRSMNGFKADEVPFGSVSLTKAAAAGGQDFIKALGETMDSKVRPAYRELASRLPGIMNRRKVYWVGGAAWGTATFMRPDQAARDFVRMDSADVKRFLSSLKDKSWSNYKPSAKASAKAKAAFEQDAAKVLETFSRDNLLSGVNLFDAFLNDRGVEGPIYFARNGQWIMGYAASKFADEVWADDAVPE